jgi:hypothetical protein
MRFTYLSSSRDTKKVDCELLLGKKISPQLHIRSIQKIEMDFVLLPISGFFLQDEEVSDDDVAWQQGIIA